ncbi:hypothetical protein M9H77_14233 [Catharanthus roseus]|uniref:Uncharacterized protein n=1 Tax=Catharanthus roseus TaxID=4058 RepID=A0ACC0BMR0_CATRO|nr:hypothetical protein M9H77_14233 [Catharanthus roseus]
MKNPWQAETQKPAASRNSETGGKMYKKKKEISLNTAVVETDGGNQTKEMTKTEQLNGHRADKWSPSSGNAASRHRTCKAEKEDRQGIETQRTPAQREEQRQCRKGRKAEEPERVQLELKETERRMKRRSKEEEETAQETRRQDGLKRGVTNGQPGWPARTGPGIS